MPEVRGTAEPNSGAYLPCVCLLVRPLDTHHYPTVDGRAETDRLIFTTRTLLRTILLPFEAKGVLNAVGPVRASS